MVRCGMRVMRLLRSVAKWACVVVLVLATGASVATRWGGFVWAREPVMVEVDRGQARLTVRLAGNGVTRPRLRWWHPPVENTWSWVPVSWNRQTVLTETMLLVRFWLALPLTLAALVSLAFWWPEVRGVLRRRAGRCAACGYDRRGLGAGALCPECGAA